MAEPKIKIEGRAIVHLTVEVSTELWGDDCTIGQLYKQAAEDGISQVRKLIVESQCKARLVGEPKVVSVLTEKAK